MDLPQALAAELEAAPRLVEVQLEAAAGSGVELGDCVVAVGSGDSYAAALVAQAASGGRVVALDPYEAAVSGLVERLAGRGCGLLALSVGGRTRAVVEAAERARRAGGRVVAVTANPASPLAGAADVVVKLVYGSLAAGVGAARHLAMLAALAGLYGYRGGLPGGWERVDCGFLGAETHAGALEAGGSSLFAVLKLYEAFGSQARWWPLEQLLHAPVYSAHSLALYEPSQREAWERTLEAVEAARRAGQRVSVVPRLSPDPWGNALAQAAAVLSCLAVMAERLGAREPAYRRHRGLGDYTRLIYHA